MESTAESVPTPEPALESPAEAQAVEPEMPESFNIFEEEPSQPEPETHSANDVVADQPRKSKQFLEKIKQDRELRNNEIQLKQREEALSLREQELKSLADAQKMLQDNPDEFLKSQGIDPMDYYRRWTERMISGGEVSVETQMSDTQKELEALKQKMTQKEQADQNAKASAKQQAAYQQLIGNVEQFASSSDGYETIKGTCTAKDVVDGMITHFRKTGEEITVEEAFEKIEAGLREREEKYFSDPGVIEKLRKYNPEAFKNVKGPQATLSAKWKEQPTRKAPSEMTDDEIIEHWKGKLFT
jgi:hypothetical protein